MFKHKIQTKKVKRQWKRKRLFTQYSKLYPFLRMILSGHQLLQEMVVIQQKTMATITHTALHGLECKYHVLGKELQI